MKELPKERLFKCIAPTNSVNLKNSPSLMNMILDQCKVTFAQNRSVVTVEQVDVMKDLKVFAEMIQTDKFIRFIIF